MKRILRGDARSFSRHYRGEKFHAMLCDPPYELGFMGKDWDKTGIVFDPATWAALSEHLHPGGFGMAFASSRGWHRLAVAIEDAGLRIHPSIFGWSFGSGFPKATRIDTQIDKAAGAEREVKGQSNRGSGAQPNKLNNHGFGDTGIGYMDGSGKTFDITAPATSLAKAWEGHRYDLQAMKPALEPIIVFQKPYEGKPVECIVETGAGALNIDGARIPMAGDADKAECENKNRHSDFDSGARDNKIYGANARTRASQGNYDASQGRWPANFFLGDEEAARRLGEQSGERHPGISAGKTARSIYGSQAKDEHKQIATYSDKGTAARFFFNVNRQIDEADPVMYCAKASRKERDAGLEGFEEVVAKRTQDGGDDTRGRPTPRNRNHHPTIKPIDLTRWLATLLLPPSEYLPRRILVPFAGAGSEMIGASLAGWEEVVGIEMDLEYVRIARARLAYWAARPEQLGFDL